MRPLELRLRNFRSYFGDGHTFDFRDRHLVGIVGPIGSGKSTVLDAIAFALFGRTPRIARSTKSLIHQRADAAAVALRFEIDGQIWEAVRQLRRSGASQHALYLLDEDTSDPDVVSEKVVLEGDVNQRIEDLLGLDHDAFGRSVMLAQGQFAEFLNARPADRDRVLKGVFGHERIDAMRELAKVKVKDAAHELEKLSIRLEQTEAAQGRLAGRRQALALASGRLEALEGAEPDFQSLHERKDRADRLISEATDRLAELTRLAERLPDSARSEEAIAHAERARLRRAELAADLAGAHDLATAAESQLKSDEFTERAQRFKTAAEIVVRLESLEASAHEADRRVEETTTRLAREKDQCVTAGETVDVAEAALQSAAADTQGAGQRFADAEARLMDARHRDMASSLRAALDAGQPCPVCEQPVHDLPSAGSDESDLRESEERVNEARATRDRAEAALRSATGEAEKVKAALEAARVRVGDFEKEVSLAEETRVTAAGQVATARREIEAHLGPGDPSEVLETERLSIDQLGAELEAARKTVEDIRRTLDEAINVEQEADRTLGDLRTQLVALASHLDDAEIPEDDPGALRGALEALRTGWKSSTDELQASIDESRAEVVLASGQLAELREQHSVTGTFAEAIAEVRAEIKVTESEIVRDEELVAAASDVLAEREALDARASSFQRLASDLTDARFIRFLLDEERSALAELGSNHFQRLSSGRYRFSEDGEFRVIDLTSADSIRKADSLSGGETFLASLGLALGLSEMVGRTGGRLDAFFLDEGFGSLDSEHLDLAMDGIEALITDHAQRLVVVVSHVPELRHRIEDLIVLDKDPITGDSVVVSGTSGR